MKTHTHKQYTTQYTHMLHKETQTHIYTITHTILIVHVLKQGKYDSIAPESKEHIFIFEHPWELQ